MRPAAGPDNSPTITSDGTRAGIILGTAAYMSPEQARGRPVDKRSDIWAFGCVLYEMLTGRRAFEGDNVTDLLAEIVGRDPDFGALPAATPPAIRRLLRRCLEKDAKRRLSDIADARLEIEEALTRRLERRRRRLSPRVAGAARGLLIAAALGGAAVALVAAAAVWGSARRTTPSPSVRFVIVPPATEPLYTETIGTPIAISPDGQHIVYVGVRGTCSSTSVGSINSRRSRCPDRGRAAAVLFSRRQVGRILVTGRGRDPESGPERRAVYDGLPVARRHPLWRIMGTRTI